MLALVVFWLVATAPAGWYTGYSPDGQKKIVQGIDIHHEHSTHYPDDLESLQHLGSAAKLAQLESETNQTPLGPGMGLLHSVPGGSLVTGVGEH